MIQHLWQFFPFLHVHRSGRRHVMHLMLVAFVLMGLPALAGAQPTSLPDTVSVDDHGDVTAADALLIFQYVFDLVQLDTCQQSIADVSPQPAAPNGSITALDALCILQNSLGLPSCLDSMAPPNHSPTVNAGPDRSVAANTMVLLSGTASDPDGAIAGYLWEQTAGPMVSLVGAFTATAAFTAPDVSRDETLSFRLTVTDDDGAQASDTVSVAITATAQTAGFASVSAGGGGLGSHTCGLRETGEAECWGNDEFGQSTPPSGTFTSISLGGYHTCGLRDTGEAVCWGRNDYAQSTPPAGIFTSLSAGTWHTCGVRETGRVECWGGGSDGRADPPAGTFISVSAGFHTCGVRETGRVECWGRDFSGQSDPPAGTFISVSAGTLHTCGVRDTGAVECWGDDDSWTVHTALRNFCLGQSRVRSRLWAAQHGHRGMLGWRCRG